MTDAQYEDLSRQADEIALQGDKDKARQLLEKGLEDARHTSGRAFESFFMGELCFLNGDYGGALSQYDEALSVRPGSPLFLRACGAALTGLGRSEEAVRRFDKAIAIDANRPEALRAKGVALSIAGKHHEAIDCFKKALSLSPEDYHSLREIGNALGHEGKYGEAVEWLDKAIAIKPKDLHSLRAKGTALVNLDRPADAIEWFDKALATNPRDHDSLRGKGVALANLGRHEEALPLLEESLLIAPNDPEGLALKGAILSNLGRHAEAFDLLEKALASRPDDYRLIAHTGAALIRLGRNPEAIQWLDRALAINPADIQSLSNRGVALGNLGRHQDSLESFDKALAINPRDYRTLRNKGVAFGYVGRYQDALECFERAAAIKPDYYESIRDKGSALSRLGRHREAIECFDKALTIDARDADALREKAFALHSLGCRREALQAVKASLDIDSRNTFARFLYLFLETSPELSIQADKEGQRRREEETNRALLQAKLDAWEALTARSAHRIGSQTFGIRGSLRELSSMGLPPEAEGELERIDLCIARVERILDEFSRFVSPVKPRLRPCDARDLMRRATRRVGGELKRISVQCNFPEEQVTIEADPEVIEEAIEELLINAARALNGRGRVTLALERASDLPAQLLRKRGEGPYVLLSVEDNGPGVKPEFAHRVFEPFFSTYPRGTGLGLSLVRKTVEAHSGVIRETGTYGKGARFEIFLPMKGGHSNVQGSNS